MTAIAVPGRSNFRARSYRNGSSEVSQGLQRSFDDMVVNLRKAVTWNYLGNTPDAFSALLETYQECYEENWDGYDAMPISQAALSEAERFLGALPSWIPAPEIVPEPDGDIGFEWNRGKDWVFVASVNGTNRITYAGLFGIGNKTHGTELFDGSIPKTLSDLIARLLRNVTSM